jgi:regulatory protein
MIITAVNAKPRRRNRVEIYVDGELAFDLARDTVSKGELRPGRPIDRAEIEALVAADARRSALATAAAMLAHRPRSEREIRGRLAQRKCEPALIDETVERLRDMKLIDDAEFARAWAESRDRSSPRGRRLIAGELLAYGVTPAVAGEAAATVSEADAAYRVAWKRMRSLAGADYRAFRGRLGSHLQRRGFAWEVVRGTVERCWSESGGGAPADDLAAAME